MIAVLAAPFFVACGLLALAGTEKAIRPSPTSRALSLARLPSAQWAVRVGGAGEAALGVAAATTGSRPLAALVAVSYALFAGFVCLALTRGTPLSSCGCLGKVDTPPTAAHVMLNVSIAAVGIACAATGQVSVAAVLRHQPLLGVPFLWLTACIGYLVFAVMTSSAGLLVARRQLRAAQPGEGQR